ncbi:hypothetical protein AAG906_024390 [Vitis piasezkii]
MNMGGCHISNSGGEGLPPWHHSYTSTELLSALMPQPSYPPPKHEMAPGSVIPTMMPHQQMEATSNCQHLPSGEDDSAYDKAQLSQLHME